MFSQGGPRLGTVRGTCGGFLYITFHISTSITNELKKNIPQLWSSNNCIVNYVVLGELVHKSTKLVKITLDKHGNEHGHFLEVGDGHTYRFYTNLKQRQNVITGEDTTCWDIPKPMEGLLDENISKYIVPDMHA